MSKKDKDKRKKADGRTVQSSSSWLGDLRRVAFIQTSRLEARADAAPEDEASEPSGRELDFKVPPLRPLGNHAMAAMPTAPPRDAADDEEMSSDIAPVGPTEVSSPGLDAAPDAPDTLVPEPQATPDVKQLEQQIRDLEARLDTMIQKGQQEHAAAPSPSRPSPPRHLASVPSPPPSAVDGPPRGATAREVLSSEFYVRQWGRAGLRKRAEEVDEFGFDPAYENRYLPILDFLYRNYFRVEAHGTENVPDVGRCLLVANHSGGPLPYDGLMLRTALRREHPRKRDLRWLAEDFIYYLPFVGTMMNRLGAVRACQENAERLLDGEQLLAVFPEGAKGIGKLFRDRYKLQRFGRGGFIRLCLRTGTPIVPCAIVGAEEANPMLYRLEYMTKALGIPYLPVTPTFPALGPIGLLPAPTKWKIAFGEPMSFGEHGPEAADDEILVRRLSDRVRAKIQEMLETTLQERKSIWFG